MIDGKQEKIRCVYPIFRRGNSSRATSAGNGINPGTKELMSLAEHFSIRNGEKIIQEVKSVIEEWDYFANESAVTSDTTKSISNRLKEINR